MNLRVHDAPELNVRYPDLGELIALPDAEAAEAMQCRMAIIEKVEEMHEHSYAEVGIIAEQFQKRGLWRLVKNPMSGEPFTTWSAWAALSGIRCRRIIMESKGDIVKLADVPVEKLIDVPKGSLKVLIQLSTHVRNDPEVLKAAKTLQPSEFEEKIEREHPMQHLEVRRPLRFNPGKSGAKTVEEAITWALEHGIAGTRDEALVYMAETALKDWQLDEELKNMPQDEQVTA